jgi:hypothetical protein
MFFSKLSLFAYFDISERTKGLFLSGWGWETISAFSIKGVGAKDSSVRNQIGEWVNAQFSGKDGSITMEWYQIHEGKIIYWYQANGKPVIQ